MRREVKSWFLFLGAVFVLAVTPTASAQESSIAVQGQNSAIQDGTLTTGVRTESAQPREDVFRVGVLVGLINLPRPLDIELFVKLFDLIGLQGSYSVLPQGLGHWGLSLAGQKDKDIASSSWEVGISVFPFRGSFYLGSSLGWQNLTVSADNGRATGDVSTLYVKPRLGWLSTWQSGVSLGFEVGVQLPLKDEVALTGPTNDYVAGMIKYGGQSPIPSMTLRLGYLF